MKLYLDTGNVDEIKEIAKSGLLNGVTTNPTLIAKEGKDFKKIIKEIIKILDNYCESFTVSAEVTNLSSSESMIEQGRELAKIDKHILVKIPLTMQGLEAVNILSKEEIRCNVTLCFSANQALMAAKAGAWCVSPFLGRLDDEGQSGLELVDEIKQIYKNYGFETKILAASIRSTNHVLECAKIGCDIATLPAKIFKQLYHNPLTDIGLEKFEKDWKDYEESLKKK